MKKLLFILIITIAFIPLFASASLFSSGYNSFGIRPGLQAHAPLPKTIYYPSNSIHVNGYLRNNGTYVNPYYRTRPDQYLWNNYSYRGW